MTFQKCTDCKDKIPHGYFIGSEKGILRVPVHSLTAGHYLMTMVRDFDNQDKASLDQQMLDAGLPKVAKTSKEDVVDVDKDIKESYELYERSMIVALVTEIQEIIQESKSTFPFSLN
jgi:predicted polyphosphate/ATP-dependent NAD kinase